jgi:adenine-specific DNA-methyltransferase
VWKALSLFPSFSLVDKGIFNNDKANLLTSDTVFLKFLLGFFNSALFQWIFQSLGVNMGKGFEYKIQFIVKTPIPLITPNNRQIVEQIEALVDEILASKKANPQADTSSQEKKIDSLVYQLYQLSEEEIKIIEGKNA